MQNVSINETHQVVGGSHLTVGVKANVSIINAAQLNISVLSLGVSQTNAIVVSQGNGAPTGQSA